MFVEKQAYIDIKLKRKCAACFFKRKLRDALEQKLPSHDFWFEMDKIYDEVIKEIALYKD